MTFAEEAADEDKWDVLCSGELCSGEDVVGGGLQDRPRGEPEASNTSSFRCGGMNLGVPGEKLGEPTDEEGRGEDWGDARPGELSSALPKMAWFTLSQSRESLRFRE